MTPTTIELPDDVLLRARDLARRTNRRVEEVLAEAVAQGLDYDHWFRAEVEDALRSTAAGRFVPPEEVEAMWDRLTTPEAMAEAEAEAEQWRE